jgi:hypothetical protein
MPAGAAYRAGEEPIQCVDFTLFTRQVSASASRSTASVAFHPQCELP